MTNFSKQNNLKKKKLGKTHPAKFILLYITFFELEYDCKTLVYQTQVPTINYDNPIKHNV